MNAPEAHYVANAGAKIQPFFGISITLHHFLAESGIGSRQESLIGSYFKLFMHKDERIFTFLL